MKNRNRWRSLPSRITVEIHRREKNINTFFLGVVSLSVLRRFPLVQLTSFVGFRWSVFRRFPLEFVFWILRWRTDEIVFWPLGFRILSSSASTHSSNKIQDDFRTSIIHTEHRPSSLRRLSSLILTLHSDLFFVPTKHIASLFIHFTRHCSPALHNDVYSAGHSKVPSSIWSWRSLGFSPSMEQPIENAVPKISLTVPANSLAWLFSRIWRAT